MGKRLAMLEYNRIERPRAMLQQPKLLLFKWIVHERQ